MSELTREQIITQIENAILGAMPLCPIGSKQRNDLHTARIRLRGLASGAEAQKPLTSSDAVLLPGLREALKWKPNTPQLENAMTYAWESAIKSFIGALEKGAPSPSGAEAQRKPWKQQDADTLAAAVDRAIRRGHLDPRSEIGDCRLDYGEPFSVEETDALILKRKRDRNSSFLKEPQP